MDGELTKLGKYQVLGLLGRGAMGLVYRGFDPQIERAVAIKTMRRLSDDGDPAVQEAEERFRREAKAAGRLSHPGIVAVYDFGEQGDQAFIVMELVEGRVLKEILATGHPFAVADVIDIMSKVLSALDYSHRMDVVHRDIKPGNIILTASGEVKIMDFGVARLECSTMTQTGTILGTPSYMSPEQFLGESVDGRSDIFSAGAVLYELLTGQKAFAGSFATVMQKVVNLDPPQPSLLRSEVPAAFDGVVRKAMAKRCEDRYQTATEFSRDLIAAGTRIDSGRAAASIPPETETAQVSAKTSAVARLLASTWMIGALAAAVGMAIVGGTLWLLAPPAPAKLAAGSAAPAGATPSPAALQLSVTTDRGVVPSYRVGEALQMTAQVSADAFVYCFYQPALGPVVRLFPNKSAPNAQLRAGTTLRVPGEAPFRILFDAPDTRETAGCVAAATDPAATEPTIAAGPALSPLPFVSIDALAAVVRQHSGGRASISIVEITVNK